MTPYGRPELLVRFGLTLALGLSVLAPPGTNAVWGLTASAFLPEPARWALGAAGLAGIWWPWSGGGPAAGREDDHRAGDRFALLAAVALAALWVLFPVRSRLFGDTVDIIARLGGSEPLADRSPLYNLVGYAVAALRPDHNRDALASWLRAYSVLCGVLYLGALLFLLRRSHRRLRPAGAALLLGGYLCLFQGHVEAYAPAVAFLAVWAAAALEPRSRVSNCVLVAGAILAFLSHSVGILLLPVTLVVLSGLPRDAAAKRLVPGAVAAAVVLAAFALFRNALPSGLSGLDPVRIAVNFSRVTVLAPRPWSDGPLSVGHLLDVVNGIWVGFGPALFLLPAFLFHGGGRAALKNAVMTPVGAVAILGLGGRFLLATSIGPVFDWDLMCLFAWPSALVLALAWSDPAAIRLRRATPAVFVTALALFAPWAILLHSDDASAKFVAAWRDGSPAPRPYLAAHADHRLGNRLADAGRQREAAELFTSAGKRFPRDVYARRAATAWLAAGDPERSRAEYEKAVELNPDDLVSRRQLGFHFVQEENGEAAERQFRAVIAGVPDDGRARFGLGLLAGQRGDRKAETEHLSIAVPALRANLERDPGNASDRLYLAEALNRLGRYREALPELTRVLTDNPGDLRAVYNLGVCYAHLGRLSEARDIFARGAEASPGDFKFLANLGSASLALSEWSRAVDAYTKALALRDVPVIRRDRARAYLEMGDREAAREDLDRVLAVTPRDSVALALRARIGG